MDRKIIVESGIFSPSNMPEDEKLRMEYLHSIGYLDFLRELGYTPLVFGDGRFIFFPVSALPPGITEGDKLEIVIRRLDNLDGD